MQGECSYSWGPKKNSIVGHFKIKAKDEDELVGTVHLVWDPYLGSIRAWYFDSDGGFGESKWRHTGDNIWIADAHSVTPEGNTAAAQNFYKRLDANSFAFKSVGRKLGDSFLPNVDFVKFVRKPQKSGDKQ